MHTEVLVKVTVRPTSDYRSCHGKSQFCPSQRRPAIAYFRTILASAAKSAGLHLAAHGLREKERNPRGKGRTTKCTDPMVRFQKTAPQRLTGGGIPVKQRVLIGFAGCSSQPSPVETSHWIPLRGSVLVSRRFPDRRKPMDRIATDLLVSVARTASAGFIRQRPAPRSAFWRVPLYVLARYGIRVLAIDTIMSTYDIIIAKATRFRFPLHPSVSVGT